MNKLEELRFNTEALLHAVKEDKKFFAAIFNFVEKLNALLTTGINNAKKEDIKFLAQKIDAFFNDYRPLGDSMYFPPPQTSRNDDTVKDIFRISYEIANLDDDDFQSMKPLEKSEKPKGITKAQKVFIGHGRSKLWARLQVFLKDELGVDTVFYESESRVGDSIG